MYKYFDFIKNFIKTKSKASLYLIEIFSKWSNLTQTVEFLSEQLNIFQNMPIMISRRKEEGVDMTNGFANGFYPHYDLAARIQHTKLDTGISGMYPARMTRMEEPAAVDFKGVLSGLIENFNKELNAPDNLLKDVMSGSDDVDIHDVMTAMSKAEINVNVATQITGKIIQAYDKIIQLQV